jgi:hypothetical protein
MTLKAPEIRHVQLLDQSTDSFHPSAGILTITEVYPAIGISKSICGLPCGGATIYPYLTTWDDRIRVAEGVKVIKSALGHSFGNPCWRTPR